ncbi:MAG: GH32 C-terminal domain-containing protein, partial [Verrucomicrobiota bacterium]
GSAYRLLQRPVKELARIGGRGTILRNPTSKAATTLIDSLRTELLDVELVLDGGQVSELVLTKGESGQAVIGVNPDREELSFDRRAFGRTDFNRSFPGVHSAPLSISGGKVTLRMLIDRSSIELFANEGESVISDLFFTGPGNVGLDFDRASVSRLTVFPLKGIWK